MKYPPERWRQKLLASQIVTARAVLHFRLEGYEVVELPYEMDAEDRDYTRYPDRGDILVVGEGLVEVKGRNIVHDANIPFKHDTVILGEEHNYQPKEHPLWGVASVNKAQTGFLWIGVWARDRWFSETIDHEERQMPVTNLVCPTELAVWHPFRT